MTAKLSPRTVKQRYVHEFDSEWEINKLDPYSSKCIRTEAFSPIYNINVSFCFEMYYQEFSSEKTESEFSCFKLNLIKLFGSDIPTQLDMKVEVDVKYSNYQIFKSYKLPPMNVAEMDIYNFNSEITKTKQNPHDFTDHKFFLNCGNLTLHCHMTFFDGHYSPQLLSHYQCWVDNLKDFAGDFKDVCASNTLSDFKTMVEGNSIPAHKIILAAHSPIFMKMLSHDFLESKNNCITVNDVSSDIFEQFLKYLYSGKIENESDVAFATAKELYSLADKYDVSTLKRECVLVISKLLTLDTVCEALNMAYNYNDDGLKKVAKTFAASHMEDLIPSENWKQLVKSYPEAGYEVMLRFFPGKTSND